MEIRTITIDSDFIRKYYKNYIDFLEEEFHNLDLFPDPLDFNYNPPSCQTFINALRYYEDTPIPLGYYVLYPYSVRSKIGPNGLFF